MEVISSNLRKARKNHICDFCKGKIVKGETYRSTICKGDEIYGWKSHQKCEKVYNTLKMSDNDMGDGIDSDTFGRIVQNFLAEKFTEDECDRFNTLEEEVDGIARLLGVKDD